MQHIEVLVGATPLRTSLGKIPALLRPDEKPFANQDTGMSCLHLGHRIGIWRYSKKELWAVGLRIDHRQKGRLGTDR